ncbi:MAG: amidohydrolase family protein [Thermoproteota archaeon]
MYPNNHHFSLSEWCVGELLSELEEYRMPLLIDFSIIHYHDAIQKIQWNAIYDICKNHKNLPVILLRMGLAVNRNLFPLLALFENLYVDISYYQVNNGIETICEKFGAHHLLFGTGLPVFSPAAPLSMLMYSGISIEEKKMIGGENLKRLLKLVSV